jgi:hypothetical protein
MSCVLLDWNFMAQRTSKYNPSRYSEEENEYWQVIRNGNCQEIKNSPVLKTPDGKAPRLGFSLHHLAAYRGCSAYPQHLIPCSKYRLLRTVLVLLNIEHAKRSPAHRLELLL